MEEDLDTKHLYLAVTTDENDAEHFNVKVLNDSPFYHQFEFSITSKLTKMKPQVHELMEWEYYLETNVNPLTGRGREPPRMRINTNSKYTRLLLKKRINPSISSNTKQWRKGSEAYYISCIRWLHNGYFCVKESHRSQKTAKQDGEVSQKASKQDGEVSQKAVKQDGEVSQKAAKQDGEVSQKAVKQDGEVFQKAAKQDDEVSQKAAKQDGEVSQKTAKQDGEVSQKAAKQDDEVHYKVCIEPSINPHCDEHKVFMLFKLQPV